MYAHDHQIYEVGKDLATVKSSLSKNAEKASKWYEDNMFKGNYSKYKTMAMQNKRGITNSTQSIQGSEIESTEKLNLLLVTINSKLNFNHHINNVCKKASQRIGVLMRLKNLIPTVFKPSCIYIKLTSYHTLLIVTLSGTFARQAIGESLST